MRYGLLLTMFIVVASGGCGDRGNTASDVATPPQRTNAAGSQDAGSPAPPTGPPSGGTVPIQITATIEGRQTKVTGAGECEHSAEASIYERAAKVWTARYQGEAHDPIQYSNLTVWQENAGGKVAFNLSMLVGGSRHDIATVQGGDLQGSGTASLAGAGGGRLSVTGQTAEGKQLQLQVECERFTELIAEGG